MSLYLFADNNEGTAENLGSYRLYNMKIEGDSEGVESGVNYVDYLESDGASYIDTGIMTNENTQIEVTCQLVARENYRSWFGSDKISAGWQVTDGNGVFRLQGNAVTVVGELRTNLYGKKVWKMDTSKVVIGEKIFFVNIDGVDKAEGTITKNENSTKTLKLFASHVEGDVIRSDIEYSIKGRIYDFKVHMDGQLKMHLKPCLDTEGIPCMYDEVSGEYFYNQGTGTFGYKKKLRDFQPVLDSNGVPCLMDKINKKYYYDKNGKGFGCDGYSGVSYIKGDGASWIDTGIYANPQYKYELVCNDSSSGSYERYFGVSDSTMALRNEGGKINFMYLNQMCEGQAISYNQKHTIIVDKHDVYVDNQLAVSASQSTDTAIFNQTVFLFDDNKHSATGKDLKVYSFKMWNENNELVFDGIPVLDNEGTPCMYDLVTETFFYNQGTGEFSYGIEEDEYSENHTPIKYIETNGTQYIDTGVVPTDNTDIDMVARAVEGTTYKLDYFESSSGFNYLIPIHVDSFNSVITNHSDVTVRLDCYTESLDWWGIVNIASGETVDFNASYENCKHICICFQDTDIVKLNEYTFMLNNLTDSFTSNYLEDLPTCSLYLMNGLTIDTTYNFNEIDTTVEPNLTASAGATLTLGSTYMAYLTEDEIEQAVDNGWTIQ